MPSVPGPNADNRVHLSVTGAGSFQGADNGKQDDAEGYEASSHDAFNGKLLAIVESSTSPGPIEVRASSEGLLPATTTLYSSGQQGSGLIAIERVYLRTRVGDAPSLPGTVEGVRADGSTESLPVSWSRMPGRRPGVYTVLGNAAGTNIPARERHRFRGGRRPELFHCHAGRHAARASRHGERLL